MPTIMRDSGELCLRAVPTCIRGLVLAAYRQYEGCNYRDVGLGVARRTRALLEAGDCPGEDVDSRLEDLRRLLDQEDTAAVLAWYRREFPECMSLIPAKRRKKFVEGVFNAYEGDLVGF